MEEHPLLARDPVPLAAERRSPPGTPAIRLLAAILEDACFCLAPAALVSRGTRADAIAWVRGEVESAAFCSFGEVCDVLGLDVEAVRHALLARAAARPTAPRPETVRPASHAAA